MAGLMLSRHHSLFIESLPAGCTRGYASCVHRESSVSPQHALPRAAVLLSTHFHVLRADCWCSSAAHTPSARCACRALSPGLARAPSCSRPVGRAERLLVQTALSPTLSQWVPALGLIHPHVPLRPCTPLGVQSLLLSTWRATANRLGMLPVPDMCAHCPFGAQHCAHSDSKKDTRAHVSPTSLPQELE